MVLACNLLLVVALLRCYALFHAVSPSLCSEQCIHVPYLSPLLVYMYVVFAVCHSSMTTPESAAAAAPLKKRFRDNSHGVQSLLAKRVSLNQRKFLAVVIAGIGAKHGFPSMQKGWSWRHIEAFVNSHMQDAILSCNADLQDIVNTCDVKGGCTSIIV